MKRFFVSVGVTVVIAAAFVGGVFARGTASAEHDYTLRNGDQASYANVGCVAMTLAGGRHGLFCASSRAAQGYEVSFSPNYLQVQKNGRVVYLGFR